MIGFFRKIRKKLADDNNFIKYSRYAIGEILLVVVGILIAVQINSVYNKNSQLNTSEKLLERMIVELKINNKRLAYLDHNGDPDLLHDSPFSNDEKVLSQCLTILNEGINTNNIKFLVNNFQINTSKYNIEKSVYEEMINTGNLYQLNSSSLINEINTYYRLVKREDGYHTKLIDRATKLLDNCQNWNYFQLAYNSNKEQAISNNSWLFDNESDDYKKLTNMIKFTHQTIKRNRERIYGILENSNQLIHSLEMNIGK